MKQRFFAVLLLAVLFLAACGRDEVSDTSSSGTASSSDASQEEILSPAATPFSLAVYSEFSLHPTLAANRANLTLAPLLYEGLFSVDASFQAHPVLCCSYTVSEDKLTWTFTLQSGITFSDGTPLTGQAAADALNLARSERGRYRERLAGVAAIASAEDTPNQLTITLYRPDGSLPLLLDIPIALGDGDRPAGTGPYVLSGSGENLSLTARAGWWQKEHSLPFAVIPLHCVHRSEELIYAFDGGEVSLVDVDLMATNAMGYGGNYQAWDYPTTDFLYLGFNTQAGPCRNSEFRRCLAMAVERDAIASTAYANHAVPAALPVHPASPLYSQSAAAAAAHYDPETLVVRLGELRASGSELTLAVNSENTAKASAAHLISYQLEAAGLKVQLRLLPFEDYLEALRQGDFDLYLGETVFTAGFDLSPLLSSSGALNYGGWRLEEADICLAAMHGADDEKASRAEELFALLDGETPIVPILFKNGSALTQWGCLSGLSPVRGNVFYGMENWIVS